MAATGTPTPNIGLRIPIGTDPASVDDINYNSNLLDTKLGAVGSDSVQDQIDTLNGNMTDLSNRFGGVHMHMLLNSSSYSVLEITKSANTDQIFFMVGIGAGGIGSVTLTNYTGATMKNLTDNAITLRSNSGTTIQFVMPSQWYRIIVFSNAEFSIKWTN